MTHKTSVKSWILFWFLSVCFLPGPVPAHVAQGTGERLQFYSYQTSNPPKINGSLTDASTPIDQAVQYNIDNDEWKDAYIRYVDMVSTTGNDTIPTTFFFMNDDSCLYVGVSANFNNSSIKTYIQLLFDQGAGGASHNNALEGGAASVNNGEYAATIYPNKGYAQQKSEASFNGTTWVEQATTGAIFTGKGKNTGVSSIQLEFKIPINGNAAAGDDSSYLNVSALGELGLYFSFYAHGGDVYYNWPQTNQNINDAGTGAGWVDLKLGVQRKFVTFYATMNANGNPVIDGNIKAGATPDDAWRGCYTRDLVLTNFAGSTINATLYAVEDNASDNVYIGLKVNDDDHDAGDYAVVYQEEGTESPSTGRNFLLDNGAENAVISTENAYGAGSDRYWNGGGVGLWSQDADSTNQNSRGAWYTAGYYEHEFLIDRNSVTAQDINMSDGKILGFLIKYHDNNGTGSDYFWEHSPNKDNIEIDPNSHIFSSAGWPDLQLGAPYVQAIFPTDGNSIEGVVNVRVYATDEDGNTGITAAKFFRAADTSAKTSLVKIHSEGEWSAAWDVQSLNDGLDTLVLRVTDNDGITIERLVTVNINNAGAAVDTAPAFLSISPVGGTVISGTQTITISATAGSGTLTGMEISIDGKAFTEVSSVPGSHALATAGLEEGSHTIQLKATNSADRTALSQVITYFVKNSPTVSITSPVADSTVSDTVTVSFTATAVAPATISLRQISVDGGTWDSTSTAASHALATASLTDGAHTLQIKVTDTNGKTGVSGILKINVANSPTVNITSPAPDSVVHGTVVIGFNATAIASASIFRQEISVDGGAFRATSSSSTDTLDTEVLTEGSHTIKIRVTDSNGKTGNSEILKFVVQNAPAVVIIAPAADLVISGTTVITFTATPVSPATVDSTEISLDGGDWRATSSGSLDTLKTDTLSEGTHYFELKVTDSNGKAAMTRARQFQVKNAPAVAIAASIKDTTVRSSLSVPFTAEAVSPATMSSTVYQVDGGAWQATSSSGTHSLDVSGMTDGGHQIIIKGTDNNGKTSVSQILSFVVDNSAPKISLPSITYPEGTSSGKQGAKFIVSALAIDLAAGMDTDSGVVFMAEGLDTAKVIAVLHDDGLNGDKVKGDNIFSHEIDINVDTTADVAYSIRARDAVGNDSTITSVIKLDNTAPVISFSFDPRPKGTDSTPSTDSLHGDVYVYRVMMKGNAKDTVSGLASVVITTLNDSGDHVNNSPIDVLPDDSGSFSAIINLVEGNNNISLAARDKAGNMTTLQGTLTYILPKVTKVVTEKGGLVTSPNRSKVDIPKDALFGTAEITMRVVDRDEEPEPLEDNIKLLGIPHEFGPDGTVFRKPVTITLAYTDLDLDPDQDGVKDYRPEDLAIYYYDGSRWLKAGTPVPNDSLKQVSVEVNHFTLYDIAVNTDTNDVVTNFEAYWTNNPIKQNGDQSSLTIHVPKPGKLSCSIFDMAGDLVYELIASKNISAAGIENVVWNGQNVNGNFSGAGLYIYLLKYTSNDNSIKKTIRKPVGLLKD